jgi:hypothetical protein
MGTCAGSPYVAAVEEHEPSAVNRAQGLEQRECPGDVGVPVDLRSHLGLRDEVLGREVQRRLGADVGQHGRRVVQRGLHEPGPVGDGVGVAGGEVVEHRDGVAGLQQGGGDHAADVAGATGDENPHASLSSGHRGLGSG